MYGRTRWSRLRRPRLIWRGGRRGAGGGEGGGLRGIKGALVWRAEKANLRNRSSGGGILREKISSLLLILMLLLLP